jgi:D-serine deaminase-like pyridoxal phosphate-dependent protein
LDTPALLVDLDVMETNIAGIAETCRRHGVQWRPHIKGQKVPAIAHKLLGAGAIGVTCAKLDEAELMAASGIEDILIANQVVGQQKIARLAGIARHSRIIVSVDDVSNLGAIENTCTAFGSKLRVVVEVDCGLNRAGVQPGEACVRLAERVAHCSSVEFAGLMTWEGHTAAIKDTARKAAAVHEALDRLTMAAELCRAAGHPPTIVSCGGTGTYRMSVEHPGITEIQAGGGIFSDVRYATQFGLDHPYALTVLSTVTSRPTATRIVCDAGKKSLSVDAALPVPIGIDDQYEMRFSAEHSVIELANANHSINVGDKLAFVVGYSDTTVNLHDVMVGMRGETVEIAWPISGRGLTR